MKLATRLTLALSAGILVVHLCAAGYRVYRENELFRADIGRDSRVLGRALAFAAERAWQTGGEREVIALAEHTTGREEHTRVRWIGLEPNWNPELAPANPTAARVSMERNEPVTVAQVQPEEAMLTYVPVQLGKGTSGALEIADPLEDENDYIQDSIVAAVVAVCTLAFLCGVLAWLISARMIADPIRRLILRARGVAAGDLGYRVEPLGSDELRALGGEMNRMCDRLQEASERAQVEASARAVATEQLRHADRLATVGSLASSVAHELGTPLNVVEGHAQLIREVGVAEQVGKHLSVIEEQCRRMTALIRQWLDFSRRGRETETHCDVRSVVASTLDMLRPMVRASGVMVHLECTESRSTVAIGAGALQQVILNLAVNAIQAMPKGGDLNVSVGAAPQAPRLSIRRPSLLLRLKDTGVGIPADAVSRVFEPFFTTKAPGMGTGLGLSIASGIVHEYGGWFEVASTPGAGTTFDVFLPTS